MPKVYSIDGITPVVDPAAYVHPSAVLIGDVIVGPGAYIGPCACLRGDFGRIVVEAGANVQDTCVMHGFPGKDTVVGRGANIGHGAVLHGCVIGPGALVGMNCVINDNADIGEDAIVAAMAFVKAEAKIPARALAAGIPAKVLRTLSDEEVGWKRANAELYQALAARSANTMQLVDALAAPEPGRKRISVPGSVPLSELKAGKAEPKAGKA
ncbi:MAG: transferase hexapeptide repeat family protein [Betaproteobacteria bacterium]